MLLDTIFYSEKNLLRKIALLVTIPCAVLPIMMATAGLMSAAIKPILFQYDFVLFCLVYIIYGYGLIISYKLHRVIYPLLVFLIHVCSILFFVFEFRANWLGYLSIGSIMATSLTNQYYRIGSVACNEDCVK